MSVAVITGTSNLNPLEVDVAKVAVVELDPRTRHLLEAPDRSDAVAACWPAGTLAKPSCIFHDATASALATQRPFSTWR
jgi:hypothetical protein